MMKRRHIILIMGLLMTLLASAQKVTREDALRKARNFMPGKVFSKPIETRSTAEEAEDYYVFNAAEGGGFVIVSADERTEDIIGYSPQGSFDTNNMPDGLRDLLAAFSANVRQMGDTPRMKAQKVVRYTEPIPHLITTRWDQGTPYNLMCPEYEGMRCVTGCTATCLAQIMNYYKYPKEELPALPGYTTNFKGYKIEVPAFHATTLKWDQMKDYYDQNASGDSAQAVAELMRYVGQAVEMQYSPIGSGGDPSHFDRLGYNIRYVSHEDYSNDEWEDLIHTELMSGRPVAYIGGGLLDHHTFICDGYDGKGYYSFNWGWGGIGNDFFWSLTATGTFNASVYALIEIEPGVPSITPETSITSETFFSTSSDCINKTYHRISSDDDFEDIFWIISAHEFLLDKTAKIEYKLVLHKDGIVIKECENRIIEFEGDQTRFEYWNIAFGKGLQDGEYYLSFMYRPVGSSEWQQNFGLEQSLIAEITGNDLRLINGWEIAYEHKHSGEPIINSLTIHGKLIAGRQIYLTANVTNATYRYAPLLVYLNDYPVLTDGGYIDYGQTDDITFGDSYIILPSASGSATLKIADWETGAILYEKQLIILPPIMTKANLTAEIVIENMGDGIINSSTVNAVVNVRNEGNNIFDDDVRIDLFQWQHQNFDRADYLSNVFHPVIIAAGEGRSLSFKFERLRDYSTYSIIVSCYSENVYTVLTELYFNTGSLTGIVPPETKPEPEEVFTPSGVSLGRQMRKGLNIVRMSNGTTKKIMLKK